MSPSLVKPPLEFIAGAPMPDLRTIAHNSQAETEHDVSAIMLHERRQWLGRLVRAEGLRAQGRKIGCFVDELIDDINASFDTHEEE